MKLIIALALVCSALTTEAALVTRTALNSRLNWTNIGGLLTPAGGQTETNRLQFISGAADNATNVAVVVDTATTWSAGAKMLALRRQGTNTFFVAPHGGISMGAADAIGTLPASHSFNSAHYLSLGDSAENTLNIDAADSGDYTQYATATLRTQLIGATNATSELVLSAASATDFPTWKLFTGVTSKSFLKYTGTDSGVTIDFQPEVANGASAVAYRFDTRNALSTAGAKLLQLANDGSEKLSVAHSGVPITQGGAAVTPASAGATGTAGMIAWDASFIYICVANNTWRRVAISTW